MLTVSGCLRCLICSPGDISLLSLPPSLSLHQSFQIILFYCSCISLMICKVLIKEIKLNSFSLKRSLPPPYWAMFGWLETGSVLNCLFTDLCLLRVRGNISKHWELRLETDKISAVWWVRLTIITISEIPPFRWFSSGQARAVCDARHPRPGGETSGGASSHSSEQRRAGGVIWTRADTQAICQSGPHQTPSRNFTISSVNWSQNRPTFIDWLIRKLLFNIFKS